MGEKGAGLNHEKATLFPKSKVLCAALFEEGEQKNFVLLEKSNIFLPWLREDKVAALFEERTERLISRCAWESGLEHFPTENVKGEAFSCES